MVNQISNAVEYKIGGMHVVMSPLQALRWNSGETTEHDLRKIRVLLPDVYQIRKGGRMIGCGKSITMRRALNKRLSPKTHARLVGYPANPI